MQPPFRPASKGGSVDLVGSSVVLVGASVRAAAESARRGGLHVIGIDLFGDTDCRLACDQFFLISDDSDVNSILDACAGLPMLTVGGFSENQPLVEKLSAVCSPLGPPKSLRSQLDDPSVLDGIATRAGLRFPTTRSKSETTELLRKSGGGRWLWKQPNSSGGLGVRWQIEGEPIPDQGFIQRWVPGRAYGATFLSDGDNVSMLGVCRILTTSKEVTTSTEFTNKEHLPFVYAGSVGPIAFSDSLTMRLNRLGQTIVDSLHLVGLFNADVIVDSQDDVWLLEINARWSGSSELIERSLMANNQQPSLIAQVIGRESPDLHVDLTKRVARSYRKQIIYANQDHRFLFDRIAERIEPNQTLHDIPSDGTLIRQGEPILTVITESY